MKLAPVEDQPHYLSDFEEGATYRFGAETVSADEIVSFGRSFDMLPFHVDEAAAQKSIFGGLVASGWHSTALMMRMLVLHFFSHKGALGSPGVDTLRWQEPLRPGDRVSMVLTVKSVRPSSSKPDRGTVTLGAEMQNQDGKRVLTADLLAIYRAAPPS